MLSKSGENIENKSADRITTVLLALYILTFSLIGIIRYHLFDFNDFDLAGYSQALWNMLHGSTFSSILGVSFFANHTDLIILFILPLYLVIKTPILLLIIQTLAIGWGGYLLYRFISNLLNKTWALILLIMYLVYPPLVFANLFEFHAVVLSMPFLILTFLAYKDERFTHFLIYAILAMLCKENIPLIVAMFGVLALVDKKSLKWIIIPLLLGLSFFIGLVFLLRPYLDKGTIDLFMLYKGLGETPRRVLFSIENLKLIIMLVGFAAFLPLLSLRNLIPIAIVIFQHLLSSRMTDKTIFYHYSAKFAPFIFISAAYGLKRLLSSKYIKGLSRSAIPSMAIILLGIFLVVNVLIGAPILKDKIYLKLKDKIQHLTVRKKEIFISQRFVDMIPPEAAVVSTFRFLPKLSHRKNLYSFHHIYLGVYTLSKKRYPLPRKLDYALIDFDDKGAFYYGTRHSYKNLKGFFDSYNWEVIDSGGSTVLFKNSQRRDLSKLFQILKEEPQIDTLINGRIDDEIELIGFDQAEDQGQKSGMVHFTFYWRCLKQTDKDYSSLFSLTDNAGEVIKEDKKHMCYRIYPAHQWKKDEIVREEYWYLLPPGLLKGKYYLKLDMFDEDKKGTAKIISDKKELFDKGDSLVLLKI